MDNGIPEAEPSGQDSSVIPSSEDDSARRRFFVPLCEANASPTLIQRVAEVSGNIAFNLWKVLHSKNRERALILGLHDAYCIPSSTKVWLTTTAPDPWLERYYSGGIQRFQDDVTNLQPDYAQGPDWRMYREDGTAQNTKDWNMAVDLQEQCTELPGLVPTINGLLPWHFTEFIERLEQLGFRQFAFPGREWLNHQRNWQRDQLQFTATLDYVAMKTKSALIVLGTSSPRKHSLL